MFIFSFFNYIYIVFIILILNYKATHIENGLLYILVQQSLSISEQLSSQPYKAPLRTVDFCSYLSLYTVSCNNCC